MYTGCGATSMHASHTINSIYDLCRASSVFASFFRRVVSHDHVRCKSSLADVRGVQDLSFRNNELADAIAKDREMARVRLYERLMPRFASHQDTQLGLSSMPKFTKPRSAVTESQLSTYEESDIKTLLKPCVGHDGTLEGDAGTLRQRLAAVLHFTGLHEQYPVDLHDEDSMNSLAEEFEQASQSGMVLPFTTAERFTHLPPAPLTWKPPVSLSEARRRAQRNCSPGNEEAASLVSVRDFASLLVEAGFEDVLSVNVSKLSDQRDFDVLMLATGRSPQHAFAGAKALKFLVKKARRAQGMHMPVHIAHDGVAAWYSVTSGPISVHCMSRELRAQLDLEGLWAPGADLTWYQKGPGVLTLDSIGSEADSESSSYKGHGSASLIGDHVHEQAADGMAGDMRGPQLPTVQRPADAGCR